MRTLLKKIFIYYWQRKLVSLILAMIIWMVVNHSLTESKTLHNVAVRITNIPPGKTVEGVQNNGLLNKKISLSVLGNRQIVEHLSSSDIEVHIDAQGKDEEWIATVSKNNITCKNQNINISRALHKVHEVDLILRLSNLVKENIPIIVTEPIGEAPKGYQFNDIFPYHLFLSVKGAEDVVKRLKSKGLKLTFNLNEISKNTLDNLQISTASIKKDEVSYLVPDSWKKVLVPSLSEKPIYIDDAKAKSLRIDFLKTELIPIQCYIPVNVFYPKKTINILNPEKFHVKCNGFIENLNGIQVISKPLFAKGVSKHFLEVVRDRIQIIAIASPKTERKQLLWSVQFINPHALENRYIAKVMNQKPHEIHDLSPHLREEYLRNRFRSYMDKFRIYCENGEKLSLRIQVHSDKIDVTSVNSFLQKNEKNNPNQELSSSDRRR